MDKSRVVTDPKKTVIGGTCLTEVCPPFRDLTYLAGLAQDMGRERWRAASDVAQVVANYLRCHPRVEAVRYPGLKGDPLFEQASHTLVGGFGPLVLFRTAGKWYELECEPSDPRAVVMALEAQLRQ